jgi:methylated-DNA-[protein]-cysteine S-methyltransferase
MDGSRTKLFSRYSPYLERHVELRIAGDVVESVRFPGESDPDAAAEHDLLDRIDEHLAGTTADTFADVDVRLPTGEPAASVLRAVRTVRCGDDATVGDLARESPQLRADAPGDHEMSGRSSTTTRCR